MPKGKQKKAKSTPPKPQASDEVLDLRAAAEFLKVSKPTFYRWLAQGKIKGVKAGTQWRFYRRDLEQFLQSSEPSALQVDADALQKAVDVAVKAKGLPRIDWSGPGPLGLEPETEAPEERTVVRAAETIMCDAIDARASDIHIDIERDRARVRYRVDGVLREVMSLPKEAGHPIVSRFKLMSDLDLSERRLPQNGRIRIRYGDREYDLRSATFPAIFGESVVCRILDQSSVLLGLDKLGFAKETQQVFERILRLPQGLIIVSGPTGSGRTTTIYSALNLINAPEKKVFTIEDPVEYQLRGIVQLHVNRKAGLTFDVALRQFVRGDPDIIFVGELRDQASAETCLMAAMTGHLVLTAMLPLTAPEVVTRLLDMGLEPFIVSAGLKGVLAQRLVRKVCQKCKAPYQPTAEVLRRLQRETGVDLSGAEFQRAKGCPECRGYGFRGRTALFELLEVDDRMRELIARGATTAELREAAIQSGMTTLLADGLTKATQGITTVEEVLRVLSLKG